MPEKGRQEADKGRGTGAWPGKRDIDGEEPYDRAGGAPLFAEAEYAKRGRDCGNGPDGAYDAVIGADGWYFRKDGS